jgi:hypothetical protein
MGGADVDPDGAAPPAFGCAAGGSDPFVGGVVVLVAGGVVVVVEVGAVVVVVSCVVT